MAAFRQTLFELIKRLKKFSTGDFVRALTRGESRFVNTVVHIVVDKIGELRMLGLNFFRKKIDGFISGKVIKHIVEHAADIILTIVHDPLCFLVPEDWHRYAGRIMRVGGCVSFAQKLKAVDWISGFKRHSWWDLAGRIAKCPAQV